MYGNPVREAFLKALTPALIMTFALTATLMPLYLAGHYYLQLTEQQ